MRGTPTVPFSSLFTDTVQTHGKAWAQQHYTKNGMAAWEFQFWCKATGF